MLGLANTLFVLGITCTNLQSYKEASVYLTDSRNLYESLNLMQLAEEVRYVYTYLIMRFQDPQKAKTELIKSAKKQDEIGNLDSRAYTYALAAEISLEQNDLGEAKQFLEFAFALFNEDMATGNAKYVSVYQTYAKYLLQIGDMTGAIEYADKSSKLFERMGFDRDVADSLIIMKDAYHLTGNLERSLEISNQIIYKLRTSHDRRLFSERG